MNANQKTLRIWLGVEDLAKSSGGPAVVVQHLSEQCAGSGNEVTILTRALPAGKTEFEPRGGRVRVVRVACPEGVQQARQWSDGIREALAQARRRGEIDVVHNFGLWTPGNHGFAAAAAGLGLSFISSPCGMLAPWALRHKVWKKRIAWWLYQRRDLARAAVLVGTSGQEMQDIRRRFPGKRVALIPNGVDISESREQKAESRKPAQKKTLLFLGRLDRIKGLKNLVAAWHLVRPTGWQCIIAGPDHEGHQQELETLLRSHHLENEFCFPGLMVDGQKWELLKTADVFVLPSFTENFGIVAAEAMAAAVPVITTKGTPWAELNARRCGWWVDVGVEPLAVALREATALSDLERQAMGERGRCLVAEKYSWSRIASEMLGVYRWITGQGPQPACVVA